MINDALEVIKKQSLYIEGLADTFQKKDEELKGELDLTIDDLIAALKDINVAYEKLLTSSDQLYQGVKRVAVAEDSKEALKNLQSVLNSLEKLQQTISSIDEVNKNRIELSDQSQLKENLNKMKPDLEPIEHGN